MALTEEEDALAAEYVLGTLSAEELRIAAAHLAGNPDFARAVEAWERRLAPLAQAAREQVPSPAVFESLMMRIAPASAPNNVVSLTRKLALWRAAAVGLAALAASLLVVLTLPRPQGGQFVAVLQSDKAQPGFVATVDLVRHTVSVRRVGDAAPAAHAYELWALGAGRPAPESLGVVNASLVVPTARLKGRDVGATLLAISLEPEGGSPTGQPTGPILFTGALLPAE